MEGEVNSRILGIDFGQKYVGLAMSDPLFITALGLGVIERKRADKLRQTFAAISNLCTENSIEKIVIGYPKNLDGTENERCAFTKEFANGLYKKVNLPIFFWDERLTTVSSDKELEFLGIKDKKSYSDEMAAIMILEGFMSSLKNGVNTPSYLG